MITIQRKSMISGKVNSMVLPLTQQEFDDAVADYRSGQLLQTAFHMLDDAQREFVKTGITPQEWNAMFAEEEVD